MKFSLAGVLGKEAALVEFSLFFDDVLPQYGIFHCTLLDDLCLEEILARLHRPNSLNLRCFIL